MEGDCLQVFRNVCTVSSGYAKLDSRQFLNTVFLYFFFLILLLLEIIGLENGKVFSNSKENHFTERCVDLRPGGSPWQNEGWNM